MNFDELGLSKEILSTINEIGYKEPTEIQKKAIPQILMGRDVLGCAQTGTGKTGSFVMPLVEILSSGKSKSRMPRSLILAPTRELAMQVSEEFNVINKYFKLQMALLIGGVSFTEQDIKLAKGVDVLVATPGRLLDHIERGKVIIKEVKLLIIDEADRMLDMGFIPDIIKINKLLPRIRQTLFFSATLSKEILDIGKDLLINPKEITVSPSSSTSQNIE
ncbi:DEAD/DEAH box helicase, partial [Alphaproteobacteria bacterium]|nr:DEAD/DEAH box helicase [Alphaproteobacteria bacterium]